MKFELNEQDLKLIEQLLDMALRQGGMANKPAVDRMIQLLSNPIKEEKKEDAKK